MQRNPRRGHRPLATVLVSERRIGGVREFVFSSTPPAPGAVPRPGAPLRALMTARAFSWTEDVPAANDPSIADVAGDPGGAGGEERDFRDFLRSVRQVYRTPRRRP